MNVELLWPRRGFVPLDDVAASIARSDVASPFDPTVVGACIDLSQRILRDPAARRYPELLALAYWMRKAELHRLREQFDQMRRPDRLLVPCGTVFHLPPRNVDTMFVYSWLMSALTGNCNVMRLSPERSASTDMLLKYFCEAMEQAAMPAHEMTWIVSYHHEEETTERLSSLCDMRVIWGGDQAVSAIRRTRLLPHAREIVFGDRYSLSAIRASEYLRLSDAARTALVKRFFDDSFWFDQMACSSPRLVVWSGSEQDGSAASADFFPRLDRYATSRIELQPAASMHRFVASCSAVLESPVTECRRFNTLSVVTLSSLSELRRNHPGGEFFLECCVAELAELLPILRRKDQTLSWFGFEQDELRDFGSRLNGRAIDRIVPMGQALQFGRFWDGYDLLQSFCRQVYVGGTISPLPE